MKDLITIQQAVERFRRFNNYSISVGGIIGQRVSKPINYIYEAVKSELIRNGIEKFRIYPPLGDTKFEPKFKQKFENVCVIPHGYPLQNKQLIEGLLAKEVKSYRKRYIEKTISISIKSQISSLTDNFDAFYEQTRAEAQNFHAHYPKMVLGTVYMIAVPEYDSEAIEYNEVEYRNNIMMSEVDHYLKLFTAINNRNTIEEEEYKYEKVCLLLVDFSQLPVKIYHTDKELIEAFLLSEESTASIENLNWESFTTDLLNTHAMRFGN